MASWIVPFIASAIFCLQAEATEFSKEVENFKAKVEECRVQFNLPHSMIESYSKMESVHDLVDHKCFIKCVAEKYGFFSEEGRVNGNVLIEKVKQIWPPEDQPRNIAATEYCLAIGAGGLGHSSPHKYDIFMYGREPVNILSSVTVKFVPNPCDHIYNFADCSFTIAKKMKAAHL